MSSGLSGIPLVGFFTILRHILEPEIGEIRLRSDRTRRGPGTGPPQVPKDGLETTVMANLAAQIGHFLGSSVTASMIHIIGSVILLNVGCIIELEIQKSGNKAQF